MPLKICSNPLLLLLIALNQIPQFFGFACPKYPSHSSPGLFARVASKIALTHRAGSDTAMLGFAGCRNRASFLHLAGSSTPPDDQISEGFDEFDSKINKNFDLDQFAKISKAAGSPSFRVDETWMKLSKIYVLLFNARTNNEGICTDTYDYLHLLARKLSVSLTDCADTLRMESTAAGGRRRPMDTVVAFEDHDDAVPHPTSITASQHTMDAAH